MAAKREKAESHASATPNRQRDEKGRFISSKADAGNSMSHTRKSAAKKPTASAQSAKVTRRTKKS